LGQQRTSVLSYEVAGLPTVIDGALARSIEAKDGKEAAPRSGGEPVCLFPVWCLWTDVEVNCPIGVLNRLVTRTERWEAPRFGCEA
jgi:hypothetical protein